MLQVSVFLENAKGRLAQVLGDLAEMGVNIKALSLADTKDFGVLRLVVDDAERVEKLLKERLYVVKLTRVWCLQVEDRPGGLAEVLDKLVERGVIVEYMYGFVEKVGELAQIVLRVRDQALMEAAVKDLCIGISA
jgi:hypothetical protein